MNGLQSKRKRFITRMVNLSIAVGSIGPALLLSAIALIAKPDVETWLSERFQNTFRPDVFLDANWYFQSVLSIAWVMGICMAVAAVTGHRRHVVSLGSGPTLGLMLYLFMNDLSDPSFHDLWALLLIGSGVGLVIAGGWFMHSLEVSWSKAHEHQP